MAYYQMFVLNSRFGLKIYSVLFANTFPNHLRTILLGNEV